jgi:hypothetical protein
MSFTVINNPSLLAKAGFTNAQFKKLDSLYLRAVSEKILNYRAVDCDFDEGVACYTYYKSESQAPFIQFVIRKIGPGAMMYEVFLHGKGRVAKSGVFDRAFETLQAEIESLF